MTNIDQLRAALAGPLLPLKQYNQFVLWRLESNDRGQPTKVPLSINGSYASSTNPATWCDVETALTYANAWNCGVGFVLTDADPFRVIDIDHCYVNGQWTQLAHQVCGQFPGAAVEISQSGEGLHIWLTGALPERHSNKALGLELYARERFIALTGAGVQPGTSAATDYPQLHAFVSHHFPPRQTVQGELQWYDRAIPEAGNVPQDDEMFLRAFLSAPPSQPRPDAQQAFAHLQSGKEATQMERVPVSNRDLFEANAAVLSQAWPSDAPWGYDKSNAAFSLACRLAYWTGKDCPRIERLMNRAAFQRTFAQVDRVRGQTYMQFDVMRGCLFATNVRKWNVEDQNAEVKQQAVDAYTQFVDRIAAAGDEQSLMTICDECGYEQSLKREQRELLANAVQRQLELLGKGKLSKSTCERMVALKSAHPAPDRQAMQRQQNIAMNLPEDMPILTPVMHTAQMLDEFVFIADGSQVGSKYDRAVCFAMSDFRNLMAASRTITPDGTRVHTEDWITHPSRTSVATRTFKAGDNVLTYDPNGRLALNMWRAQPAATYTVDISSFLEHVQYLFGERTNAFLDWLAHIEQRPGVLPHFGWLHIANKTGTGRNWLSSVIARMWRGYVAPSVDMDALINGSFNGVLAGRVIAIVDEIRSGAREDAYMMEGKIRNMITEETRYIKPKYGKEYVEHNACRWLVFSNHKNAIPLSDTDRRWDVVHLSDMPRDEHVYAYLYACLEYPGYIESIRAWLAARDISAFNPGKRPPISKAKLAAIDATRSPYQRAALQIVQHWPADFITVADLISIMNDGDMNAKRLTAAQRHALDDAGMTAIERPVYDDNNIRQRCWLVRNNGFWTDETLVKSYTEIEFKKLRPIVEVGGFAKLQAMI